jgi:hypothetical protein
MVGWGARKRSIPCEILQSLERAPCQLVDLDPSVLFRVAYLGKLSRRPSLGAARPVLGRRLFVLAHVM